MSSLCEKTIIYVKIPRQDKINYYTVNVILSGLIFIIQPIINQIISQQLKG